MIPRVVGKLFGHKSASAPGAIRSAAAELAVPAPAPSALVHRDEILDGRTRISGYRFRPLSLDSQPPSPTAKIAALKGDNLASFAQRRMAVVPLRVSEWEGGDFQQFVTPNTFFEIEVPAPGGDVGAWRDAVRQIKAAGARVGMDSVVVSSHTAETVALADAVFVKPADYSVEGLDRTIAQLRGHASQPTVVADGVYSWSDYRACLGMGAHYCLGDFATTPDAEDKRDALPQSRVILIEMLNLLRGDADLSLLASMAKRDPGVALKILEMTNSPLVGLRSPAASIDQAIMVLGRDALYRWLAVAVFRAGDGRGIDETLLEIALRRGRFMELLGCTALSKQESDELFVVGLMSLVDRLFNLPMERALEKMTLPRRILDALVHRDGPYAGFLRLALAAEEGAPRAIAGLAAKLALDAETVIETDNAAHAWAEQSVALT